MSTAAALTAALFNSRTFSISGPAVPTIRDYPVWVPIKLTGTESINDDFCYTLTVHTNVDLSNQHISISYANDNINLNDVIGKEISMKLELDPQGIPSVVGSSPKIADHREINGIVTQAQFLHNEGRIAVYQLTVQSWLYITSLRSDCRYFQDMTVEEVIKKVLDNYPFIAKFSLYDRWAYIKRDVTMQYNESDYTFIKRLCQTNGISFHFRHRDGLCEVVFSDANGAFLDNPSPAYREIDYIDPAHRHDREHIFAFTDKAQLVSGAFASNLYDYMQPRADLLTARSMPRQTAQGKYEHYYFHHDQAMDVEQPNAGGDKTASDTIRDRIQFNQRHRLESITQHARRSQGRGYIRGIVTGTSFKLNQHPRQEAKDVNKNAEYIVLSSSITVQDLAQTTVGTEPVAGGFTKEVIKRGAPQWHIETHFTAQAHNEDIRPDITIPKPRIHGVETARVVGPDAQTAATNHFVDYLGRVRLQFAFDREGQFDQGSSIWVRVSEAWAGSHLGSSFLPRIGQELLVSFISGDIDKPVVTGRVHNQLNLPPWQRPDQQALSGFRSRELTDGGGNTSAGRSNHIILDDTVAKIQLQLKSDHHSSSLSLGYITRINNSRGRMDERGEGFELRTDGNGIIRAAHGLYISTEARHDAAGMTADMREASQRLQGGMTQHEGIANFAASNNAQQSGDQDRVAGALKIQHTEIQGGTASQAAPFPEFAEPHLVVASPAGIATTSAHSTHIQADEHIALTSNGHTSVAATQSFFASALRSIRLFALKEGMKLFSAQENIDIAALSKSITLLAKLNIEQTANRIVITAKEEVVINGGGSYAVYNAGGITEGTNGAHVVHAAEHSHAGPKNMPTDYAPQPKLCSAQSTSASMSGDASVIIQK